MLFGEASLEKIAEEIRRRQSDVGRLSLITFDDDEYAVLHQVSRRIVREHWSGLGPRPQHARLVFLAFTMAFVRRHKYTDDNVFWPDFETALGLGAMERRFSTVDELLWPAYEAEGLALSHDERGRRIVGTLTDEMRRAETWVTQARSQFVTFFQWYYHHCPDADITPQLLDEYRHQTGSELQALDEALPALTHDCQALARVIDFAIEQGLYLRASLLEDYRQQVIAALGPECDPMHLRLVRDERVLVRLILELQNHCTPVQFARQLDERRGGLVRSPWGECLSVHRAIDRWTPFFYGVYQVEGQEYRVVPHPRLRLEMLDEWPFEQIVHWRGGRFLGYKKRSPFDVTVGRRTIEAIPYVRSRHERAYIWVGQIPTGQKLAIDGRLRPESTGADWTVALRLDAAGTDRPNLVIAITRLMLYYPRRAFHPVRIWASTGYQHEDSLREDGVRRFHRHRNLIIPLDGFEGPVETGVHIGDEEVLNKRFESEPHYLFSDISRERVQSREVADLGDREYVLFTRSKKSPRVGPGVSVQQLPEPYGAYIIYRLTWEDADHPFELQVGSAQWSFQRRREFAVLLDSDASPPHVSLKRHQCLRFQDLSLRLYCTFDLTARSPVLEVSDEEGPLGDVDLLPYLLAADARHIFAINPTIWNWVDAVVEGKYGRYRFCFREGDAFLGEQVVALLPRPMLEDWDEDRVHLETAWIEMTVTSDCAIWDPLTQRTGDRATLYLRPRTQAEPWPERQPLRQIVPVPVSKPVSFPEIGEALDIAVRPWLFGFRLYLKREERTSVGPPQNIYQPLTQADYYQLDATALYVFSTPHSRVEIRVGSLHIQTSETDSDGNLLIESLEFLESACLGEETWVTLHSEGLKSELVIRWAPLLRDLTMDDETVILCYNGPEETGVRLRLCGSSGEVLWRQDCLCQGGEVTTRVSLPAARSQLTYLVAEYVLFNGKVRSAARQLRVEGESARWIPEEWLLAGVGVPAVRDLI